MTSRTLGIVGIRLIGLMAVVQAVQSSPTLLGFLVFAFASNVEGSPEPTSPLSYLPGILWILVLLAVGVSIIAYARPIGERLFPEQETVAWSIRSEELRVVLFSAVGALILIEALPLVLRDAVTLVVMSRQGFEPAGGWGESGLQLAEAMVRTILGLFLLLGGRQIGALVRHLRRLGTSKGEPGQE